MGEKIINAVFYKISCINTDIKDNYIDFIKHKSYFSDAKTKHKKYCNDNNYDAYNRKLYKFIRDNGGWDKWEVKIIDTFKGNKKDIENKLFELINTHKSTLNNILDDVKIWFNNKFILNDNKFEISNSIQPLIFNKMFFDDTGINLTQKDFSKIISELKIKRKIYNGYNYYYGFSKKIENNIKE